MADWFDEQVQQGGVGQTMPQVATAPDGVPVYQSGGNFYTQNSDGSYTQQFQGGLPDWLAQATGQAQPAAPAASSGGGGGDVRAFIAQLAGMPGADPSLANDPGYWENAINSRGGLTDANRQYWQDAAVGPTAFFNNPNRESGGGGGLPSISNPTATAQSVPQAGQQMQQVKQLPAYTGFQAYTPQTITQPAAIAAQQVTPSPIAAPGTIVPERAAAPGQINAQGVAMPATIQGTTVQGPQALTVATLANPTGFQGVSQKDLENNPQFQYAQEQAMQALVNSGAAKGIERGSTAWKALQDQAANIAGQQFQQIYNNELNKYQTNTQNTLNYNQANVGNQAQAYGLTNQYQQTAALANQQNAYQVAQANAQNALNAGQFNAAQQFQQQAQNIANAMQTGQFNAAQGNTAQATNIANTIGVNQFNAGQNLQAQGMNQSANFGADQFNAGMNFNTQNANQANAFNASQANNQNNLAGYNASVGNALGQGQLGLGYQQATNNYNLGLGQLGLGYANYGLNAQGQNFNQGLATFGANQGAQNQAFNQNYSLAQLGLTANGQVNGAGQNYANQGGNAITGIGNAQGAGSIAQGNTAANTLGNLGNGAFQWGLYNSLFNSGTPNPYFAY